MIEIVDTNGNNTMVELITYLISDDRLKQYIVYTKGEIKGEGNDQVIYISKFLIFTLKPSSIAIRKISIITSSKTKGSQAEREVSQTRTHLEKTTAD